MPQSPGRPLPAWGWPVASHRMASPAESSPPASSSAGGLRGARRAACPVGGPGLVLVGARRGQGERRALDRGHHRCEFRAGPRDFLPFLVLLLGSRRDSGQPFAHRAHPAGLRSRLDDAVGPVQDRHRNDNTHDEQGKHDSSLPWLPEDSLPSTLCEAAHHALAARGQGVSSARRRAPGEGGPNVYDGKRDQRPCARPRQVG